PPAAPTITSTPGPTGNDLSPTWTFTAESGATTTCSLSSGATVVYAASPCSGSVSYDLRTKPDAAYTLTVVATDAAGNVSPAATSTYVLDTTAPALTVTAAPATPGNGRSPAWSFTGEAGAAFTCSLTRGGTTISPAAPCTSPVSYDLTGQPDGTYTFTVTATDAAGNVATATSTYVLDTTAPVAPTITSVPGSPGNDLTPTWTFTTPEGTTTCSLSSGGVTVFGPSACAGSITFDLSTQPDGTYTFPVSVTDAAGNVGPAATSTYVLDTTPPAAPTITAAP